MTIELSNVRFHYPERPKRWVLNIPSWSLSAGEKVFVHGPSGGGKSTLLNLLSGLMPASEGSVTILGQRLEQMNSRQRDRFRANNIGYVFQQFNLIPYLNALDNIRLARQFASRKKAGANDNEIKALLSALNLSEKDWRLPARNLSIGQQQRVAIARALINKPQILIADEPTSSLDQANRDVFMSLLMSVIAENNMSLLLVSHDLSLSGYFNRVDDLKEINHIEGLA